MKCYLCNNSLCRLDDTSAKKTYQNKIIHFSYVNASEFTVKLMEPMETPLGGLWQALDPTVETSSTHFTCWQKWRKQWSVWVEASHRATVFPSGSFWKTNHCGIELWLSSFSHASLNFENCRELNRHRVEGVQLPRRTGEVIVSYVSHCIFSVREDVESERETQTDSILRP